MPPKRKAESDSSGECEKKVKEPTGRYTTDNERAILMALTKLALENCRRIAESLGTGGKTTSAMNMKLRSMMKNIDKALLGGDGKWVDTYKVERAGRTGHEP